MIKRKVNFLPHPAIGEVVGEGLRSEPTAKIMEFYSVPGRRGGNRSP
jgi:hypothetical protein